MGIPPIPRLRLDSEARRNRIVDAALPLFARKGFAGTTTKEIAEAAEVSEALVFKHFPTKAALYGAIQDFGCRIKEEALERLRLLEPSTDALVLMAYMMVHHIVHGDADDRLNGDTRQDSTTANMIFPIDVTIESLSKGMTLEPGDIVATGTPVGDDGERLASTSLGAAAREAVMLPTKLTYVNATSRTIARPMAWLVPRR